MGGLRTHQNWTLIANTIVSGSDVGAEKRSLFILSNLVDTVGANVP